jgi:apolipoprotein D and lipocalin family protein
MCRAKRQLTRTLFAMVLTTGLLAGCTGMPENVKVVDGFELDRYLGRWYEIARLDHSFERGLSHVTATYTRREDGGIDVVNRGYDMQKAIWNESIGKAYPLGEPGQGRLKVSFFGPFYGGYNILVLDHQDYSYALVAGPDRNFLWLLARQPQLPRATLTRLIGQAGSQGGITYNCLADKASAAEFPSGPPGPP